jgi:hypothetical protein
VEAAVDLVLTAASCEGGSSAPAPPLVSRHTRRHRRIAFGAVASTVAVAIAAAAFLAVRAPGPAESSRLQVTTAGLSTVPGCPGEYVTAGTLKLVSGTRLTLQEAHATGNVTVATNASTVTTMPAAGTASDITDGSQVMVQGTWFGRSLAARSPAL